MTNKKRISYHLPIALVTLTLTACGGGEPAEPTAGTGPATDVAGGASGDSGSPSTTARFDPDNLPMDAKLDPTYTGPAFRSDEQGVEAFTEAFEKVDLNKMQEVWSRLTARQRLEAYDEARELADNASMDDYERTLPAQYLLDAENLSDLEQAAKREARAADPTLGKIRGRVLAKATNEPIAGLEISIGGVIVETSEDGSFEAAGIRPGPVSIPGFLRDYKPVKEQVEVVANRTVETTIYLEPLQTEIPDSERGTLRGVIVDKETGEPIEGMEVLASFASNAVNILMGDASKWGAVTASDGSFEIAGIPAGPAVLVGQKPPYFIQGHKLTIVAQQVTEQRIEVQSLAGRLKLPTMVAGVVRDAESGEPVAGVQVSAGKYKGATSDAEGRYLIRKVEPGRLELVARHADYHDHTDSLVADKPGVVEHHLTIRPITTGSILGIAVDRTTGEPLPNAVITIAGQRLQTDGEGRFRIDDIESGEIAVQADSEGYRAARSEVILEARSEAEARLELEAITEGTVAGIATDASTGAALAGVAIQIGPFDTETDADGRFEIVDVPAGEAGVTARKAVYEPLRETVEVVAADSVAVRLELEPITYGTLVVLVEDASTGRAIADSIVRLTGSESARTDAQGRATFEKVAAGRGLVSAERHAYEDAQENFVLEPATELEQIVRLEPVTVGTVEGIVVAAGTGDPIPSADVRLGEQGVTSGTDGRFSFQNIGAGQVTVTAGKEVFESGSATVRVIAAESVSVEIELEPVTYGSITGVVVDQVSGKPIAGARVAVRGAIAESDSRGRFELERVPAGRVQLSASRRVYEPGEDSFELRPAQTVERRLALQPITYGRLTGRVVDAETGRPIAGADIAFSDQSATSGSDGRFEAERVSAGRLTVSARKHAYESGGSAVTLEPAGAAEVLVELEPIKVGTVVGVVKDAKTGEPIPGARVECGGRSVEADSRGRFRCNEVDAGAVGVSARHADYGDGGVSANLGGADTLEVEVRLDLRREDVTQLESALASKGTIDLYGIHFDSGKDQFKPSSLGTLNAVLKVIQRAPDRTFRIAGHTDSDASDAYNQDLSERRAGTVIRWLVERGIEPGRLQKVGFGESRPAAPNDTESGKALNRRVELSYGS